MQELITLEGDLTLALRVVDHDVGDQFTEEAHHRTGGEEYEPCMDEGMCGQGIPPRNVRNGIAVVLSLGEKLTLKGEIRKEVKEKQYAEDE